MRNMLVLAIWLLGSVAASAAEPCPGNPDALGTSRVLTVSPGEFARIGSMQYPETLPLNDHEVVITFDDGPIPPSSNAVLETLASQCVKATYFLVGEMAQAYPSIVRRIYNAGHSIGTHTQNHPFRFKRLSEQSAEQQIDSGIASVDAALGDPKAISPFFRIPGLERTDSIETYAASKSLTIWSADVVADDWKHIGASEITKRAMRRLNEKGRGILLLHDIHPATALALPTLLKDLKEQGYHVVHVVAAGERPQTLPELPATPVAAADKVHEPSKTARHEMHAKSAHHHHVKKLMGKHRRPTMANYEPDYSTDAKNWRQSQF